MSANQGFLAVTNWKRYQHYKDRSPVWIKFYVDTLHNEKLKALPLSTRLLWTEMLLLAATFQNAVPNSPELIGNLAGIDPEECREGIQLLLKGRWLREKQTRRSASKPASLEVRSKNKELEGPLAASPAAAAAPEERPRRFRVVPCAECGCGGGVHTSDCSISPLAAGAAEALKRIHRG